MNRRSDPSTEGPAAISQQELLGVSRLVIQGVIGVTDVVEAMHGTISRATPPLGRRRPTRARGLSGQIYSSIRGITRAVGVGLEAAHRWLPDLPLKPAHHHKREAMISRINGVVGDHLDASGNPLSIPMTLRQAGRRVFDRSGARSDLPANPRPVVLIHGLCMNDLQWQADGHDHGSALARDLGLAPLYLHYNTGRRISTNGRELAELLQALTEAWPCDIEELTLIGHSMGGLVIRSACHYGQVHGHDWPALLGTAIFLGSPHHGAPLERIGNLAGRLLEASPYSAPIARLGRLRSAGIQDLRHGNLRDSDWKHTHKSAVGDHRQWIGIPAGVNVHAFAASRSPDTGERLQAELLKVQLWAQETGQKFVLLFEGRDAAGKGGTIKRFTEHLNPRHARVVALNKPTEKSAASGISSATSNTCPPRARSCSMTARGTTAPAWSG
jgi:pimeloyl-ACP methyl ester carboxylesterase